MATLVDVIGGYTKDDKGVPRKWEWGRCDCIGLMFHVVNHYTNGHHERIEHLPDLDYKDAVKWLHATFKHPTYPYLRFLTEDAGLVVYNDTDWEIAVIYDDLPLPVDGTHYPIHIVPGVAFKVNQLTYIYGIHGLKCVNIYPNELASFTAFKLTK